MFKSKTHEQYVSEAAIKSPLVEVVGQYAGDKTKITHRCSVCQNEWDVTPSSILVGHGCPMCGRLKSANERRRTQEEYVAELYAINPNIEVIGTYILSQQKLLHKCKICGHEWEVAPNSLLQGCGCPRCADIQRAKHFSKGHEQYVKELFDIHPHIEVLGEYVNAHHKINHKCKICGHIWNPEPDRVLHSAGCPVCIGKKIGNAPEYKNSIWASDYREYFSNYLTEDQMKSYMPYTNKKIKAICPYCKKEKMIAPGTLLKSGLGCVCSDGQTYPNKFVWCVLSQLGVEYIPEYCPSWINPKRYDIYIPSLNCIIENHGPQHYEQCTFTRRSLQEERENDKYKMDVAISNGISTYIILDCSESTMEHIKHSILNSELSKLLDLDKVNWLECNAFATSNMVLQASNLWKTGLRTVEIANILHMSKITIKKYLARAKELGWCNYTTKESKQRGTDANSGKNNKLSAITVQLTLDDKVVNVWSAESVIKKILGIYNISPCCLGKRNKAGGYQWKHLYDTVTKDGIVIPGAITLGIITEEEALQQVNSNEH